MVINQKDLTDNKSNLESVSQSTIDDVTSTEEEAAWKIAEALGVRVDRCHGIVDSYGADHALAALADVQRQLAAGKPIRAPLGLMVSLLRSGTVQAEAKLSPEKQKFVNYLADRWHNTLADPTLDCASKQSARRLGDATVRCMCGCGQSFPSEVRGGG